MVSNLKQQVLVCDEKYSRRNIVGPRLILERGSTQNDRQEDHPMNLHA